MIIMKIYIYNESKLAIKKTKLSGIKKANQIYHWLYGIEVLL